LGFQMLPEKETEAYFSELLMEVNCVLRFDPRPLTTAIMASAMPAAIKPIFNCGSPRFIG